jgi:hypothetical protein
MKSFSLHILFAFLIPLCGITSLHAQNQVVFNNQQDENADTYILKPGEHCVVERNDGTRLKCQMVNADADGLVVEYKEQPGQIIKWSDISVIRIPNGISRESWIFRSSVLGGGVAIAAASYSFKLPSAIFLLGAAAAVAGLAGVMHGTGKLIVKKKINLQGKGWSYMFQPDHDPLKINK